MMAQDQSCVSINPTAFECDPCDPCVTHKISRWVTLIISPLQCLSIDVTHVTHESTKRLAGRDYTASGQHAHGPRIAGGNIGKHGSHGSHGSPMDHVLPSDPWPVTAKMGLDRRSFPLGPIRWGASRGSQTPIHSALQKFFDHQS